MALGGKAGARRLRVLEEDRQVWVVMDGMPALCYPQRPALWRSKLDAPSAPVLQKVPASNFCTKSHL